MLRVCSVQLAEERRGREGRMGDNLWSGLGEMFGFSWHLHFHYPGLHDLSCFTLRINQIPNILSLCVYPAFRDPHHIYPRVSRPSPDMTLVCIPASSISSRGPGLGMMTAVRLSLSPGVSGSPVSSHQCSANQRPALWPATNQRPVWTHVIPSLVTPSRENTKTICHRPQTHLANIYFYQSQ